MIFSSEQPQTGMNEGTWFTQGMCIKKEGIFCREVDLRKVLKCDIFKEEIPAGMCSSRDFSLVFLNEFFYHFKDSFVTLAGKVLQIVGRGVVVFVEFPF